MATNGHELCEWFRITKHECTEYFSLGLGLGISFSSKLYWLLFRIETSNDLIFYPIYNHFIPPVWLQMAMNYVSGSA